MQEPEVSVMVLAGCMGAGKTSVLNHLLRHREGRRIALVVNDLGESGLEFDPNEVHLFRKGEALVELGSHCIGCVLRGHLIEAVSRLARDGRFDTILIELSGVTDPLFVVETFRLPDEEGRVLSSLARLDHVVTVLDTHSFWEDYASGETLEERGVGRGVDDRRAFSELLADQVESATALVLNKVDLADGQEADRLETLVRLLNPDATCLRAVRGNISFDRLTRSGGPDEGATAGEAGWMQVLRGRHPSLPGDASERTFVYRARRPFHPERFWNLLQEEWEGVHRSKGCFWIASQPKTCYMWSQAGRSCLYERLGRWWMAISEQHWPADPVALDELRELWDLEYGDRRIELAFFGEGMDIADLTGRLDACLLTRAELSLDEELWTSFIDPFRRPGWENRQAKWPRQDPPGRSH